jgi:hypothetical protein
LSDVVEVGFGMGRQKLQQESKQNQKRRTGPIEVEASVSHTTIGFQNI